MKKKIEKNNKKKDDKEKKKDGKSAQQKKESKQKPKVEKASGTYYVTAEGLNIREGDSTDFRILGSLNKHSEISVTGKTSKGWYELDYNDDHGYVSGNYLTAEKPVKQTVKKEQTNKSKQSNEQSKQKKSSNNKKQQKNVVEQMSNLGSSEQVILITTAGYHTYTGQVRTYEKDSPGHWNKKLNATAYIGKNGFADNKVEGDGKSPTGKYTIGHAFGYVGNPGTNLSFKSSTDNDVWIDDPNSKYYNTWQSNDQEDKDWNSAESMIHELYKYGFTINYNTSQTPNKGSAIFMHVARPGTGYTTGCTAVNESDLLSIMRWVDPSKNPVIIQTPESQLSRY